MRANIFLKFFFRTRRGFFTNSTFQIAVNELVGIVFGSIRGQIKNKYITSVVDMLNNVQKAAYELIQSDARFIYTLTDIQQNAKNISSNYIMMSQPYIGLFAYGAEQWCQKLGLDAPKFTGTEKTYYSALRQSHKLYEKSYSKFLLDLMDKFYESDNYFYKIRGLREKLFGYYNVGTVLCNGYFCGNTILCALYTPVNVLNNKNIGFLIKNISVVAGKLANFFDCKNFPPYNYDDTVLVKYEDYHFYNNCPLKLKTNFGFLLFSILCSVNYAVKFIDKCFVNEILQKFKFAYLQYYYLCDFIKELNAANGTIFYINESLKNRAFRNCLAHYGLGQYISENELIDDDILKGLTRKAFNMDYSETKEQLYFYLTELTNQIEEKILS